MSITNINEATKYPSDKIKEALDIVAPIETKTVGIKKVNHARSLGKFKTQSQIICQTKEKYEHHT